MSQGFSPIQHTILSRLKNAKSLRYSEMQPKDISNDLYNYHLQFLVRKGYVEKLHDGYALSASGIKYVADPFPILDSQDLMNLFKFNVITILSRVHNGKIEILNQIRKANPSYGKVGVMGGVVRKAELLLDAAQRKLKDETGLDAHFRILGIQRRVMYKDNELFADMLFPMAYADSHTGELVEDTVFGHNMWVDIDQAIKNESAEYDSLKSLLSILAAIKDGSLARMPFFYEEDIQRA